MLRTSVSNFTSLVSTALVHKTCSTCSLLDTRKRRINTGPLTRGWTLLDGTADPYLDPFHSSMYTEALWLACVQENAQNKGLHVTKSTELRGARFGGIDTAPVRQVLGLLV